MRIDSRCARLLLGLSLLCCGQAAAGEPGPEPVITTDTGERKPRHTVVPVYPELALRERVEGDVQVCFNVDREGRPHGVKVRRSSNRIFEKPSLAAARASTFEPLLPGAQLSGIKTCRTFRFRLSPVAIERPG
jgi:TonB family protein